MAEATGQVYSPGLAGVIAGESAICSVDSDSGLRYRGYDIHDLALKAPAEQIAYLMLHDDLANKEQLAAFSRLLVADRSIPDQIIKMMRLLPKTTHPMDLLRTAVSFLAPFDPDLNDHSHAANLRKGIRLTAKMSTITAAGLRIARGQDPIPPRGDLGHSANFLYMMDGQQPQDWQVKVLDVLFALYAEHEYNASAFAARVIASTMSDMYSSVVGGIGALKGPLHGGANEEAIKMMIEIGSADKVEGWITQRLEKKEKIMGFGHRVYKLGDSRSKVLHELCSDLGKRLNQPQWLAIGEALERVMEQKKGLFSNADLYAAPIFYMMKLPAELNTPLFACSRITGWAAHVIEQHDNNRLIRPRCTYTGPKPREWKW